MFRRRSRLIIVVVLAVAVLLLYPLSFGPAYWACSDGRGRLNTEDWVVQAIFEIYSPLVWINQEGPAPLRSALQWYLTLWGAP